MTRESFQVCGARGRVAAVVIVAALAIGWSALIGMPGIVADSPVSRPGVFWQEDASFKESSMRCVLAATVLGALVLGGSVSGAPKPRATYTPVSLDFRCPSGPECLAADRIQSDGSGPYVGIAGSEDQGAFFNSKWNLIFSLQPGRGRFVSMDFSQPTGSPSCGGTNPCRKDFTTVLTDDAWPSSITNPLDAAGTSLPNGFMSIAVGQSVRARYKLNFADPSGRSVLWTVRFNSALYPGSTDVTVTRTATDAWVVEAGASDVAELVSVNTTGKAVTLNEGYYAMPFKMTVIN